MLARFLTRPSNLPPLLSIAAAAAAARLRSNAPPPPSSRRPHLASLLLLRRFSTDRGGGGNGGDSRDPPPSDPWKLSGDGDGDGDSDAKFDRLFSEDSGKLAGISGGGEDSWLKEGEAGEKSVGEDDGWLTAEGYRAWSLADEGKDDGLFDIGEGAQAFGDDVGRGADAVKSDKIEEEKRLEREEQELTTVLKGSQFYRSACSLCIFAPFSWHHLCIITVLIVGINVSEKAIFFSALCALVFNVVASLMVLSPSSVVELCTR